MSLRFDSFSKIEIRLDRVFVEENKVFAVRRSDSSDGIIGNGGNLVLSPNPTNGELQFRLGLSSKTDVAVLLSDLSGTTDKRFSRKVLVVR